MHPLIRVVCFLIFAAWLAWGDLQRLLFGALLLAVVHALVAPAAIVAAGNMILRLRWFLLSLLVVYGWFTPGRALGPASAAGASWLPTAEGLAEGLLRCAALALIVVAVNLLLRTTGREQLLGAIHGLARPLAPLGLSRERLALRMTLVMEAVGEVRRLVAESLAKRGDDERGARAGGRFAATVMQRVIDDADRRPLDSVQILLDAPPHWLQWSLPVLLWAAFYMIGVIWGGWH